MLNNLKFKLLKKNNLKFKKIICKQLNLNYSFIFFFFKKYNFFNYFFYFNIFFFNYLIKLIWILKLILLNNLNLLILINLNKKIDYFFKKKFYYEEINFFSSVLVKRVFGSYFYLLKWLFKNKFNYKSIKNIHFIVLYNFKKDSFLIKKLNKFNIPVINFNFFNCNTFYNKFDYPVFYNNIFFFNFLLIFIKKLK